MCIYCGQDNCFDRCGCNDIDTADRKDSAERERGDEIRERKEIEKHFETEEKTGLSEMKGSFRKINQKQLCQKETEQTETA